MTKVSPFAAHLVMARSGARSLLGVLSFWIALNNKST
jgi:hypothetical protein